MIYDHDGAHSGGSFKGLIWRERERKEMQISDSPCERRRCTQFHQGVLAGSLHGSTGEKNPTFVIFLITAKGSRPVLLTAGRWIRVPSAWKWRRRMRLGDGAVLCGRLLDASGSLTACSDPAVQLRDLQKLRLIDFSPARPAPVVVLSFSF